MFIILRTKSFKEIILTSNEVKKSKQNCYVYKRSVKTNGDKKIFFVKIYYLIWEPPAHSFLIKSMVPFPDLFLGGGRLKPFSVKIKSWSPFFHRIWVRGGGVHEPVLQKKIWCSIFIKTNWSEAVFGCWNPHLHGLGWCEFPLPTSSAEWLTCLILYHLLGVGIL